MRAYILCRFADSSGIYTSWMDESPLPCTVVDAFLPDWVVPNDAGILITHMHYRWEELAALRKVREQSQIPILILADGILEYRNTWEHPDLVNGSIFQPLFGHKLACLGRGQARIVESWGNVGCCEVVGLPRLDGIGNQLAPSVNESGPFRILVTTANTPAFDDQQRATVIRSLNALKQWFEQQSELAPGASVGKFSRSIEVVWRLSDGLDLELGLGEAVDPENESRPPIGEVIEGVDAVITTPSTMYLESALRQRPTAILDFHNSPAYVTAAWTISCSDQFGQIISELASPPAHKMQFQQMVLQDQLECSTPATPRLFQLINSMVAAGELARANRQPIEFSQRILSDSDHGFTAVPAEFDSESLYPGDPAMKIHDVGRLKVELAAAIKRLEQMPCELAEKDRHISKLNRMLDRSRDRVEEMHNRVVAIRKRFGVKPAKPRVEGRNVVDD